MPAPDLRLGPDPRSPAPLPGYPHLVFLNNLVDLPNVEIGDYTYYDGDGEAAEGFAKRIRYHFEFVGDRLVIGRFCAIAQGATFIMGGANHSLSALTTYPFLIFGQGWEAAAAPEAYAFENRGDTRVGNDVWIGTNATILPGVTIGDGAVIAAHAVVGSDVAPYTIVAGNPARGIRQRFDDRTIVRLQRLAWWNWSPERITQAIPLLLERDLDSLEKLAETGDPGV